MTRYNIYKRLYAHIKNWEAYNEGLSKKYCSSYKLFDEDMDNIKIEIMEKHENKTFEELIEREKYYINNFECVNINGKTVFNKDYIKQNIKKEEVEDIIMNLGFKNECNNKNIVYKEQFINNSKNIIQNNKLIKMVYHNIKTNKAFLGLINSILKPYNLKINAYLMRMGKNIK